MSICWLGHAGFLVETPEAIIIMDPWLSPTGAFDASWFQFPRNHHLAGFVQEKLRDSRKQRYIYISHEHRDHFDQEFLWSLQSRDFTLVLPKFRRSALRDAFAGYDCKAIIACDDQQQVPIPGGWLKLYLDDSELNRDSAVLVRSHGRTFFNQNDCKLFDALPSIAHEMGPVDVFACQFSGATWHPTCYDYPRDVYEKISKKKMFGKFGSVAQAIRTLHARAYLPSAGPPCFLDPTLMHLNFEPINVFPRTPKLLEYLSDRTPGCRNLDLMPGDIVDANRGELSFAVPERVSHDNFEDFIGRYAADYASFFALRRAQYSSVNCGEIRSRLADLLRAKLSFLTLADRIKIPLYFELSEEPGRALRIDFVRRNIEETSTTEDDTRYAISAPAWQIARVLDGQLTWEEFSLTFRARLNRTPDVYQTLIHGFLILEPEDMNYLCDKLLAIESRSERIEIEVAGKRFVCDRYCPHNGADLKHAWVEDNRYLTCPRHRWHFDLEEGGCGVGNNQTVHAIEVTNYELLKHKVGNKALAKTARN
jgi:UDP-MurNAc hydroxylase